MPKTGPASLGAVFLTQRRKGAERQRSLGALRAIWEAGGGAGLGRFAANVQVCKCVNGQYQFPAQVFSAVLILAAGYWLLDTGCWILAAGYWLLDTCTLSHLHTVAVVRAVFLTQRSRGAERQRSTNSPSRFHRQPPQEGAYLGLPQLDN